MVFPNKGIYKRNPNRIYFSGDFQDGEEVYFKWTTGKPSSTAKGYAFYKNINGESNLINIKELL